MTYTVKITKNSDKYNHDAVDFFLDGKNVGGGFVGKKDGAVGLQKCPACGERNHAMAVMTGVCAWCGFDANPLIKEQ